MRPGCRILARPIRWSGRGIGSSLLFHRHPGTHRCEPRLFPHPDVAVWQWIHSFTTRRGTGIHGGLVTRASGQRRLVAAHHLWLSTWGLDSYRVQPFRLVTGWAVIGKGNRVGTVF